MFSRQCQSSRDFVVRIRGRQGAFSFFLFFLSRTHYDSEAAAAAAATAAAAVEAPRRLLVDTGTPCTAAGCAGHGGAGDVDYGGAIGRGLRQGGSEGLTRGCCRDLLRPCNDPAYPRCRRGDSQGRSFEGGISAPFFALARWCCRASLIAPRSSFPGHHYLVLLVLH